MNASLGHEVGEKLARSGFDVVSAEIGGKEVCVGRDSVFRLRWLGSRLHLFVFYTDLEHGSADEAQTLKEAEVDYALANAGRIPCGLGTGVATISLMGTSRIEDDAREWALQAPKHRWAALNLPVLIELPTREVAMRLRRDFRGAMFMPYLRKVALDLIA